LHHVYDVPVLGLAINILVVGKYLAFKILAHRDLGFWRICHPCLASMAILNAYISQNPSPPSAFGLIIVFHLIQWILQGGQQLRD
jgi:hypothetical protein